jgi:multicomponent Na+:H+ antiporter subunit D
MSASNLHMYVMAAPLLTAFFVNLFGRKSNTVIAVLTLGSLAFSSLASLVVMIGVLSYGRISYTVGNWKPPFGIELVVDHLSTLMLMLISVVALFASLSALKSVSQELPGREHQFFTLYLILIAGLMGLVLTGDTFNLYVLLEITSITTYGLIAMGKGRAPLASFNYIIMGSIGACFYLLGVGYLYLMTGSLNMAEISQILQGMNGGAAVATALAFILVGLWIKMALFPLHGWLPNAYSLAPTGAVLLAAPLMTKVTIYLMVRVMFSVFSVDYVFLQHPAVQNGIVWASALAIICASALALAQRDLKRMLTYVIVAEVGYMVGGIWLANSTGMTGAILHIVNDALMTLCLFLAVAAILYRLGSVDFDKLQGIYRKMPITMAAFTVGAFAMIGIPPTAGFFSKWYLLLGGIEAEQWGYVVALLFSSLVNAVLFFRIIEIGYFHKDDEHHGHEKLAEAPLSMQVPLLISAAALIVVGLSSGPLVETIIKLALPAGF